jgi:hypothetical protein
MRLKVQENGAGAKQAVTSELVRRLEMGVRELA